MKRLLAYLFLVLGLGLVFSVSSKAASKNHLKVFFCKDKKYGANTYEIFPSLKNCSELELRGKYYG